MSCPIPTSTMSKKQVEALRKKTFVERNKIMQEKASKCHKIKIK